MSRLTPKFLSKEIAEKAVDLTLHGFVFSNLINVLNRKMCHIVVLVPSVEDARDGDYPNWPNYPIVPVALYERSVAEPEWSRDFKSIARCKAQQLWRDQNFDENTDSVAHLLFPDDTPFWGGVKRHGIVVACSGFQPYFDQLVSGMIADYCKALARFEYENSTDKKEGLAFLA